MTALTFDTLKFANRLDTTVATKIDILRLESKLEHETAMLRWMVGVLLAVALANFA